MRVRLALAVMIAAAQPLAAQEDDRSLLERFLADRLSSAGREIDITGFRGALSSQATLDTLTIADSEGVWLTIRGAELDWSRAALLRGRVEVNRLRAEEIELTRLPVGDQGARIEDAEAQPFQLPDLPVAIQIGEVATPRLALGEAVLGQSAELAITAALRLAGGAGAVDLSATRSDAEGRFAVVASYANDSRDLALDIALTEGAGGLVSGLLGLPGGPPVALTLAGAGPLTDFGADLALATDGEQRVTGRFTLDELADSPGIARFALDIAGDVAPLVAEQARPFFGDTARVQLAGTRRADGGTELSRLDLETGALTLGGSLTLAPSGLPERLALDGTLTGPVALPLAGPETRVDGARLTARFDAARGEEWQAEAVLDGLAREGLALGQAGIAGSGTIRPVSPTALTADLIFSATGLAHDDPALARALGDALRGTARIVHAEGADLRLDALRLDAGGLRATASGTLGALSAGLPLDGRAELALDDLARIAPLAGAALGGAAEARIQGRYGLLDGVFDLTLAADTRDLATGTPRLDPLLAGVGRLSLAAARGPAGTALRALAIETSALRLTAEGELSTAAAGLRLSGEVRDLARVDGRLSGPGSIEAGLGWEEGGRIRIDRLEATGAGARLTATGAVSPDDPALPAEGRVTLAARDLAPFSGLAGRPLRGSLDATLTGMGALRGDLSAELDARGQGLALGLGSIDRLIGGESRISARGARRDGAPMIEALELSSPVLRLSATEAGGGALNLSGRLSDLALLAPGFPGPLTVTGRAQPGNGDVRLALDATGPGGTTARLAGSLALDGARADLTASGTAPLALANGFIAPRSLDGQARYDLALRGPLALSSLSGRAVTEGARLALPAQGLAVTGIAGSVTLSDRRAQIDLAGALDGSGRVSVTGPVTLAAPFDGDLAIALDRAPLRDEPLFETRLDGQLTMRGALAGGAVIAGRIDLGRTEIAVPSGGATASGPIPDVVHIGESAASRATRARAGLLGGAARDGGGRPYPLDLTIRAPGQVFVRGRGLDAEVGGTLRLRGTTADLIPDGRFDLIRGRLDILSRRFDLTEGQVSLQGALDPYLRFVAATQTGDITARIQLEGRASAPEIRFLSDPDLPEDEVLARLLFGRGIEQLSAFQAVQLATAVAGLAGGNGGGLLGRIREGTGLDDLDLRQTADGETEVSVGKYLSEDLYSEVTVDGAGQTRIELNFDLSPQVTVRGRLGAEGDTGIGVFYERDY
ncbi:translocation/assembly module TamB domain-containing protein [Rhodovulum tesquicola]|uniref:translocation/assembly module TamB domain-containing protein n=1 Tax=Rhodovulum tesquicola TaxID=540254 RepID=UPI0020973992|nr:translocation/assembly module TamB domain-containing protein [Rhodovulum tesquicola]MCO8146493.1 translocation/assembly module TamB domain-containing protein [Rhodovulum tesquicola]